MIYDRYIKLGEIMEKVLGTLPASLIASDVVADTRLTFTNEARYRWDDVNFKFNNIGQKWRADVRPTFSGPDTYGGVKNCATPRRYTAPAAGMHDQMFASTVQFEIMFTGDKLSIEHNNLGGNNTGNQYAGETTVWVEYGPGMWRLADTPKLTIRTDGGASFRNITFAQTMVNKRMKIRLATAGFQSIYTDGYSVISPAPPAYMMPLDGDSWVESTQALTADGGATQYFSTGIAHYAYERSCFNIPERGQGATGFFSNGATLVTDDTVGTATGYILFIAITITGLSRWFSGGSGVDSRMGWITDANARVTSAFGSGFVNYAGEDFGQPLGRRPVASTIWGTWNDRSVGTITFEQMYDRSKYIYQTLHALDPYCTFIHVSPEPFDDGMFGNFAGAPRRGSLSHDHVLAQMKAASEVPNIRYINAYGPDDPWWRGQGPANGGTNGVPIDSQQARIVSKNDGIHYRREGGEYAAMRMMEAIAEVPVLLDRVMGLK